MPGAQNMLVDVLSRLYSDEAKGTVRASSEYLTVEGDDTRSKLILSLISAPCYTVGPIFLGAARKTKASRGREAFPNAKKVILKYKDTSETLEGVYSTENSISMNKDLPETTTRTPARIVEIIDDPESEPDVENTSEASPDELALVADAEADEELAGVSVLANQDIATEILGESPVSLTELLDAGDPTLDIHGRLRGRYSEDPLFKLVLEKPAAYKNFEVSNGLIFLKQKDVHILCIPDIAVGERHIREMLISHAHSILAHLGPRKTITYLRDNVWWRGLTDDIHMFCDSCGVCKVSKPSNHAPYGLPNPLEIPNRPWETIGIDFVGPLHPSKNVDRSYDMILVVICHLTSMVHLIPTKQTYKAKDIAEVLFDNVYKLHGMPKNIVSDRDSLFTSIFWNRLNQLTGVELRMSSAYHPQSDGATERANRTMTQMLCQCVGSSQKDWAIRLPAIEFAMNSACSSTTGFAPFMLNNGRMPLSMIWNKDTEFPGVRNFAQKMKDAILTAHDAILEARVKQTRIANRKRKDAPFIEGDLMYLSTKNITLPKGRARKLAPKFVGPY